MPYHFGNNEYIHLIGRTIGISDLLIENIEYSPDNTYIDTDGYSGKPYLLILSNGDKFQFRQFEEVINKYGNLN
jgi:uncharacterized protein YlzI (FlbEa/FlbD family)